MKSWLWASGAAIALGASIALAQDAPESLLPPGFDDPPPAPSPAARPAASANRPAQVPSAPAAPGSTPVVQPLPGSGVVVPGLDGLDLGKIPSMEELEGMSTDELDELLGLKPKFDIPPGARRSMERVGILHQSEGGLPSGSLAKQPAALVRAALAGTKRPLVSRWGHILLRRTLASRLAAPAGMNPVEFASLRMVALNRMGEFGIARAVAQDVDTANWNRPMIAAALTAYIGTQDIVGVCPAVRFHGSIREDATWTMLQAICNAYAGEGALAGSQFDRALRQGIAPRIDVLLAQRFAGAAGNGRRAVDIEWDDVEDINPWRFALANALGEEIPESLSDGAGAYYERVWANAPMIGLPMRARGADRAAREGLLSARAMVDLYSQIYADDTITGEEAERATQLRDAYTASSPKDRLAAMQSIWGGDSAGDYGRYVLTAYAAARIPADSSFASDADALIASMLTAGLDRDAMAWRDAVEPGSAAWGQIVLVQPGRGRMAVSDAIDSFIDDDASEDDRKSQFLIAGLAALGRISDADLSNFSARVDLDLNSQTKWSRMIARAARLNNRTLVALLAGLGMQGQSWKQMTPRHLYHIVSALNRVGLQSEARMIAAEAVARG
ncbi:MAG: hypothetical protein EP350_07050 [Alphaproteobacteria bacterium]|nr:MAG: hypothetical protein EP350_07050 [Alphaproteobacteria bacterium]